MEKFKKIYRLSLLVFFIAGCNSGFTVNRINISYALKDWSKDNFKFIVEKNVTESINSTSFMNIDRMESKSFGIFNIDEGKFSELAIGSNPDFSDYQKKVVFENKGEIYIINSDGSNLLKITGKGSTPRFSPNGSKIIYLNDFIYLVDTAELKEKKLSKQNGIIFADWSPDGENILFVSKIVNGYPKISVLNLAKETETIVTDGLEPLWTPDGKEILFFEPARDSVFKIKIDGTDKQIFIKKEEYKVKNLSFSPNGSKLVFSASTGWRDDIDLFLMELETKKLRQITKNKSLNIYQGNWISGENPIFGSFNKIAYNRNGEILLLDHEKLEEQKIFTKIDIETKIP